MRNVTILLAVAAVLALAVPASAAVLVETNFDGQTVGAIDGQSTGGSDIGLTGTWTSGAVVVATNVSYSSGEVSIDGGANALRATGTSLVGLSTAAAAAVAAPSTTGETLYVGMLFHLSSNLPNDGDYCFAYLGEDGTGYHARWGIGGDRGDGGDVYGCLGGASIRSGKLIEDETLYVVGKLVSGVDAADWTTPAWVSMQIFYNPVDLDESSASNLHFDVPANDQTGTLSHLGIRSVGLPGDMDIGYMVVGDTWGDVVVPEPATMVLLGIGGIGVLIRRRRR